MKLSDHIKVTIHHGGEATVDVELDGFMKEMSARILNVLKSSDKMTREQADEAFSDFFCKSLREVLLDMSDEAFGELLVKFVEEFSLKGPELDAKAIASGGVGGIPMMPVDDDKE